MPFRDREVDALDPLVLLRRWTPRHDTTTALAVMGVGNRLKAALNKEACDILHLPLNHLFSFLLARNNISYCFHVFLFFIVPPRDSWSEILENLSELEDL
jgi:hypothetical protein